MKYLIRNNKVEYSGTQRDLITYIVENYPDDYWVQEYSYCFYKDPGKFKYCIECLGFRISGKPIERKSNERVSKSSFKRRKK